MVNSSNYYFKKDIVKLIQQQPILPIDEVNDDLIYKLLLYCKCPKNFLSNLPYDIVRHEIIPYLRVKFNINIHFKKFKIIISNINIRWIVYFDITNYDYYNSPVYKVESSDNNYVNHTSFNLQLINLYFDLYCNWLDRINLIYITFQYKKFMVRWMKSKKHKDYAIC